LTTRIAWLTDIHLEFLTAKEVQAFLGTVAVAQAESVLVGGDTGTAKTLCGFLLEMEIALPVPVYFVLGNHDFYGGSIADVREMAKRVTERSNRLSWLPRSGVVGLTPTTALIGHDSWADGRCGDYHGSSVMLNDYFEIEELSGLNKEARLEKLNQLGDEAARYVRETLTGALQRFPHVIFLTHAPPFREACWYQGEISGDDFLPHFSCKAVGDALREVMGEHVDRRLTVLCGHTHGPGTASILPNLRVVTGGATYGKPQILGVFDVDDL